MKLMTTKVHGVLDYVSVASLLVLPRVLDWRQDVTRLMTASALGILTYSLLTRYELGAVKLIPVKGHLGLDAMSGLLLCAAPALFPHEETGVKASLVGMGLFAIAAALTTETEPRSTALIEELNPLADLFLTEAEALSVEPQMGAEPV